MSFLMVPTSPRSGTRLHSPKNPVSIPTTSYPAAARCGAMTEPIYPLCPVIRIRFDIIELSTLLSLQSLHRQFPPVFFFQKPEREYIRQLRQLGRPVHHRR